MNYFDIFKELGMVTEKGDIRQDFEERVDGMVLGDRIRKAWLFEDTKDIEGWDALHQPKYQKEFIFNLFMHIEIGGSVNQWYNNIAPYLNSVKLLYKDLITVAKDNDTQEIKSFSHCFRIDKLEGCNAMYPSKSQEHYQNATYVLVDPINWHVTILQNRWQDFW